MGRLENMGGDRLARGAASFTFKPMGEKLTRENWDKIFDQDEEPVVKAVYLLECPVHGVYKTDRECFVSGGFPQLDETLTVRCKIDRCGEVTKYAGYETIGSDTSSAPTGVTGDDACGTVSS